MYQAPVRAVGASRRITANDINIINRRGGLRQAQLRWDLDPEKYAIAHKHGYGPGTLLPFPGKVCSKPSDFPMAADMTDGALKKLGGTGHLVGARTTGSIVDQVRQNSPLILAVLVLMWWTYSANKKTREALGGRR